MTMTAVDYPVAPVATKRRSTLLDVATVTDTFRWHDGLSLYESFNCMQFGEYAEFCEAPPATKDLDQQAGWIDGFRFAAYGGYTCRALGSSAMPNVETIHPEVTRAFEIGESKAVEVALMEKRFAESDGSNPAIPAEWDAPEDITPAGGAVSVKVGVALLEEYAGTLYVGAPTLHVPISVGSLLLSNDGAKFDGDIARTHIGSPIAIGAGYSTPNLGPDGNASDPGERWLYATGTVLLQQSERINVATMATEKNDVVALVERGYIASVDCFTAAIRVTVE